MSERGLAVIRLRIRAGLAIAALAIGMALNAPAVVAKSVDLTSEQAAAIQQISSFLNSYRNLQGDFTQVGPKGNISKGVFYIAKPGKMRFEYAPPNPMIIVSDGNWVTIKNRAKEKFDEYPLSQTPLRLVVADKVNLLKETNILNIEQADGLTAVTLEDRKKSVPGQLVLVFDEKRQALHQWIIIDGKGRRTTVSLENLEAGGATDAKLFKIERKRIGNREKAN
jgi:outer membrane lipoprotein-sorting protein